MDLYYFLAGFMFMTAMLGFAFTAGRNYEKRQLRKRTIEVAAGTAYIGGKQVEIAAQTVPLAVLLDAYYRQNPIAQWSDPRDETGR